MAQDSKTSKKISEAVFSWRSLAQNWVNDSEESGISLSGTDPGRDGYKLNLEVLFGTYMQHPERYHILVRAAHCLLRHPCRSFETELTAWKQIGEAVIQFFDEMVKRHRSLSIMEKKLRDNVKFLLGREVKRSLWIAVKNATIKDRNFGADAEGSDYIITVRNKHTKQVVLEQEVYQTGDM